ncbi:MAG: sirohydrochlorin cobaltochelatase, partial [Megasphaera micronuciformis]|nr:sirohydrochlorin cobaltochelatase [Megasphaera micronuciformis]
KEGYTRVAITSLDVIPGMEYAYDTAIYDLYKNDFKKMTVGTPIMYWMGQEDQRDDVAEFVEALKTQLARRREALPAPQLVIDEGITDFYEFRPENIRLEGYTHKGKLPMEVAV